MEKLLLTCFLVLLVGTGLTGSCLCTSDEADDLDVKYDVEIVNAESLSKPALAEATAAKGLILDNQKFLRQAAKIGKNNPRYWYYLAVDQYPASIAPVPGDKECENISLKALDSLSKALKANPNYLPALYLDAAAKPTHKERIEALQHIAAIDKNNAKPYYLMAMLQYKEITAERKISEESDKNAFPMSHEEWKSVLELISKGNERKSFESAQAQLPSLKDVRVSIQGSDIPQHAIINNLQLAAETECIWIGDLAFSPTCLVSNALARQFAREAAWEADKLEKAGEREKALDTLTAVRVFGERYAASKPYRIVRFLVGKCVQDIVIEKELALLGDSDAATTLKKSSENWKDAVKQFSLIIDSISVKVEGVYTAPDTPLEYVDFPAEEAAVKSALKRLRICL